MEHVERIAAVAEDRRTSSVSAAALWTLAFAFAAVFLAARTARAQNGGFHPNVMQQGGRNPRPAAPTGGPSAQSAPVGNSMFPTTPSTAGTGRNRLQAGPSGRWWDDKQLAQTVGLRLDQKSRMDAIFNNNKVSIVSAYQTLMKEQKKYAALSRQSQPNKAQMFASIDAVNEARTSLEKATDKMLLEIRSELDTTQLARLESMR